jgi:NDP-sugar pyrophosphorylase family protein
MIKAYFEEFQRSYNVYYLEEDQPLGTAGSLRLLDGKFAGSFFVSNCDILIETDYAEILAYHYKNEHDLTLVGSVKHYRIPYGVCEIENGGRLTCLREKPEYNFLVNTGLYVMKSEILSLIPENKVFDMTELIETLQQRDGKIGVFPVSEKAWIDMGEWEEYKKGVERLKL